MVSRGGSRGSGGAVNVRPTVPGPGLHPGYANERASHAVSRLPPQAGHHKLIQVHFRGGI